MKGTQIGIAAFFLLFLAIPAHAATTTTTNGVYIINTCDEYFGIMHDFDAVETKKEQSIAYPMTLTKLRADNDEQKARYVLAPSTCPATYQGIVPSGKTPWEYCPLYSTRNSAHECKCAENFFSFANICESGWEYCRATYGTSVTWDTYQHKCACLNPGDVYDTKQKRCITPLTATKVITTATNPLNDPKSITSVIQPLKTAPAIKYLAKYFIGTPKTTTDLLNCMLVGDIKTKIYRLRGSKTIKTMTVENKVCFVNEVAAKKGKYVLGK